MGLIQTLADMETRVSQDLNDVALAKWPLPLLDRCIERAVKEYSFVWPRLMGMVMPGVVGVRYYPLPQLATGALAAAPAAPVLTEVVASGALPVQKVFVKITAANQTMESPPSAEASFLMTGAGHSLNVALLALPAGADHWNVYAGLVSGGEFWNGNFAAGPGTYVLSALSPQASVILPGQSAPAVGNQGLKLSEPTQSQTAWWVEELEFPVGFWPPRRVPFKEPTGQGQIVALDLPPDRLPQTITGLPANAVQVLNVVYACVHQLDSTYNSILDQDTDVIATGAVYYALLQYGVSLGDNFQWFDGEMRDHLDDSMVPKRYQELAKDWGQNYRRQLKEVKTRRDFQAASIAQWGDVPRRWDRL